MLRVSASNKSVRMRDVQSSSPRDPTIQTVVVPSGAGRSHSPGSPSVLGSEGKSLMGMLGKGGSTGLGGKRYPRDTNRARRF